jgi:hypothetical protein
VSEIRRDGAPAHLFAFPIPIRQSTPGVRVALILGAMREVFCFFGPCLRFPSDGFYIQHILCLYPQLKFVEVYSVFSLPCVA